MHELLAIAISVALTVTIVGSTIESAIVAVTPNDQKHVENNNISKINGENGTEIEPPEFAVTKWIKNLNSSDYNWAFGLRGDSITYLQTNGSLNVNNKTILAELHECYTLVCRQYYEIKLEVNFPSTRKDSLTQYRGLDDTNDLFDAISYNMEATFRFFTEHGKNGSITCRSVDHPHLYTTVNILTRPINDSLRTEQETMQMESLTNSTRCVIAVEGIADLSFSLQYGYTYCYDKYNQPTNKSLIMISCPSPSHCDLYRNCLKQLDNERGLTLNKCDATLQTGIKCETADCRIIDEGYPTGVVQCTSGQDTEVQYFFTGFDKRRYKASDDVPKRALISMDEVDPILYTNKEMYFFCAVVRYLFIERIQFSVIYRNGTQAPIPEELGRPATKEEMESRVTRETFQSGIHVNLTTDMTEIVCMAPWFNSTDWLTTSRKFQAKDVIKPAIKKPSSHRENTLDFFLDETGRTLVCAATGQPPPSFTWHYNDKSQTNTSFSTSQSEGETILKLPRITNKMEGEYTCVASNGFGNDSLGFHVRVHNSRGVSDSIIITVVIITLIVFSTLFGLLWRKYQITKKKLRNLTKSEVDEFEKGDPEALALMRTTGNGPEINTTNIHLLPFNRDYIINPDDLSVDKTVVLGKGMYGIVYRGQLLGDAVAVKTTLPHADVMYFKALLSEVKVMTYIGKHKNIVNFIGAVIKNIRKRVVYVAVEFSPYGDLESFLKSHRSTFLDLNNTNHLKEARLDVGRSYVNTVKRVTTLDMLNWSHQIASGMNYLAKKKVVHADLATRNVLLFHGYVTKITDFGLSRQMYEQNNYVKKQQAPLPWRWMAIEALRDMNFSTLSDVWSYGVTVWEVFSMAETPFPGLSWDFEFMERLKEGLRMSKPLFSSAEIYEEVMLKCWNLVPESRPSFEELQDFFSLKIVKISQGNLGVK